MPRERPITLQDIARRARVSKMTVSLALREGANVSAGLREKLRALAREMGYRPNPLIVANMALLRGGRRSSYIGKLAFAGMGALPELAPPKYQIGREYLGAQRRAESLGYQVEWISLGDPAFTGRRISDILAARGILGVVLALDCVLPPEWHLDWSQFALAATGRTEVGHELHRTMGDYYRAVREACQTCRARGYRRIGLAVSQEHNAAHHSLHRSAFLGCQVRWPRDERVPLFTSDEWTAASFLKWLRRHEPDVVITGGDQPVKWLAEAGLRTPGDLGLIRPHLSQHLPAIAGFLFREDELGAAAVDLVVEQLNHNERGLPEVVKRVLLPGRWSEGSSLRPLPLPR